MSHSKENILKHCVCLINDRIDTVQQSMQGFQQAANEDSKSSMGDKYETNRAMMHLEKEKAATQLNQLMKMRQVLDGIRIDKVSDHVGLGSLVSTEKGKYFISIGLGPIKFEQVDYFVISAASPIGQVLMGKQKGDSILFRNEQDKVLSIE